jgi:hypothetical protein
VRRPGVGIVTGMDGPGGRWLLLHGTPLTPQVWDGVAGHLRRYGPVGAALAPVAPLFAEGVA